MPRIGLVYEDEPIHIAVGILAPKILGEPVELVPRLGGSWPGIVGQLPDLLQALSIAHLTTPLDCVLVVVDANGTARGVREERLREKVRNDAFRFGRPIFHAIVRHIEAWVAGDPEAVNLAAGKRIPVVREPEQIDAKRHLIQVLKNNGANPYGRAFVRTALEGADINRISERCPGFREFALKVRGCQPEQQLFQAAEP